MFIDNFPFNIESPQELKMLWSPEIDWDYENGYPTGDEDVFKWSSEFMPYKSTSEGVEVFHVWFKYKIGKTGNWSIPARVNYPIIVKGDKGDKGDRGERGYRGIRGAQGESIEIQYADKEYNIVPNTSSLITFMRVRLENGGWTSWLRVVGVDGVGTGGIGLPVGGMPTQLVSRTATGYEWIDREEVYNDSDVLEIIGDISDSNPLNHNRYTDAEAVAAMGTKDDTNPLNHDKYTDAEAINATLGALSASEPIILNSGNIEHSNTVGNKHVPAGDTANYSLIGDGSGNLSWALMLFANQLDDAAGLGDTDKLLSANEIYTLFNGLSTYGIRYSWADQSERDAQTGMSAEDLGLQRDTREVYQYDGSTWNWFFNLDAVHNHDDLYYLKSEIDSMLLDYYTKTELQNDGTSQVHWNNLTDVPEFADLTDISASSPIDYDSATGVISHAPLSFSAPAVHPLSVINRVTRDSWGHLSAITFLDLEDEGSTLEFVGNGIKLTRVDNSGDEFSAAKYVPFSYNNSFKWSLVYAGQGGTFGNSDKVARADHLHNKWTSWELVPLLHGRSHIAENSSQGLEYRTNVDLKIVEIRGKFNAGAHIVDPVFNLGDIGISIDRELAFIYFENGVSTPHHGAILENGDAHYFSYNEDATISTSLFFAYE